AGPPTLGVRSPRLRRAEARPRSRPRGGGPLETLAHQRRLCFFVRVPQLATGEVAQLRVWMARLNLLERRRQLVARRRTEGSRLAAEDDRPVGKTRRHHDTPGARSRRLSFSISVVRLRFSSRAACTLLPCVRSSERLMIVSSTPSMYFSRSMPSSGNHGDASSAPPGVFRISAPRSLRSICVRPWL